MTNTYQPESYIELPFFPRPLSRSSNPEKTRVKVPWPRIPRIPRITSKNNPGHSSIRKLGQFDTPTQIHTTEEKIGRLRLLRRVKTRAF